MKGKQGGRPGKKRRHHSRFARQWQEFTRIGEAGFVVVAELLYKSISCDVLMLSNLTPTFSRTTAATTQKPAKIAPATKRKTPPPAQKTAGV
ncbi:MAG: hypothetical protein OXU88_04380, partial [Gammaproteobacteria bacterium]|nr:hypothetical protein [Gammaproteobacteria bacterium]